MNEITKALRDRDLPTIEKMVEAGQLNLDLIRGLLASAITEHDVELLEILTRRFICEMDLGMYRAAVVGDNTDLIETLLLNGADPANFCLTPFDETHSPNSYRLIKAIQDLTESGNNSMGGTIPTIRRAFPKLVASDLVGVQPMNGPVGFAYAMRQMQGK